MISGKTAEGIKQIIHGSVTLTQPGSAYNYTAVADSSAFAAVVMAKARVECLGFYSTEDVTGDDWGNEGGGPATPACWLKDTTHVSASVYGGSGTSTLTGIVRFQVIEYY